VPNPESDIMDELERLMKLMNTSNGYQYDWGTVEFPDESLQTLPAAFIFYEEEKNSDYDMQGREVTAESNVFFFKVTLYAQLSTSTAARPRKDITDLLLNLKTDFKRLINNNNTMTDTCDDIAYIRSKPIIPDSNDALQPAQLDMFLRCQYQQYRNEPKNRK